jgi:hypothetical protein
MALFAGRQRRMTPVQRGAQFLALSQCLHAPPPSAQDTRLGFFPQTLFSARHHGQPIDFLSGPFLSILHLLHTLALAAFFHCQTFGYYWWYWVWGKLLRVCLRRSSISGQNAIPDLVDFRLIAIHQFVASFPSTRSLCPCQPCRNCPSEQLTAPGTVTFRVHSFVRQAQIHQYLF